MDFHKTSITGILLMRQIKMTGNRPMLTAKLHVLLNISAPCWQIFTRLLYKNYLDETIEMRGNNPMLTWKLYVFLNILAPCWQIFTRLLEKRFFWWDNQSKGQQPYANIKTAPFVEYLGSMLTDFHETSITGIPLMRWSKWGVTALC